MGIYTKKGDTGFTQTAAGERVAKTHPRIAAVGDLDELSSLIGRLSALMETASDISLPRDGLLLTETQQLLFRLGAWASDPASFPFDPQAVRAATARLEAAIDEAQSETGGLFKGFVLPGGHPLAAETHVVRSVCRRVERNLYAAGAQDWEGSSEALAWLNRLSDYFYALAKKINHRTGCAEKKCT